MFVKSKGVPLACESGDLHNDPFKGSLLEQMLNHTGSEQCLAPMSVKPRGVPLPVESGLLHNDPSKGSLWEHILRHISSEQC